MPKKKRRAQQRIAFGSEIYIIHSDYLTLEYDDVTTRSVASFLFAFSFWQYLCYTQMPLTQTLCVRAASAFTHTHALLCAAWFVQSSYIVSVEHSVDICMCHRHIVCLIQLTLHRTCSRQVIYLFCKRTQYKCGTKAFAHYTQHTPINEQYAYLESHCAERETMLFMSKDDWQRLMMNMIQKQQW